MSLPPELLAAAGQYTAQNDAVAGSVAWSALAGVIPLVAFFLFLMGLKWPAHWSSIGAVGVALVVAVAAFGMPVDLSLMSMVQGVAFGLFPIVYIIWMAVWIYDLTVKSQRFEDMRVIFSKLGKGDMRVQAMIIGFAFGGLLEALAGFGAPVAIVSAMLIAIGLPSMKAVLVTFVANAAPVAFGAMAIPIATGGGLTGIDANLLASMAGRQVSVLALVVPFILCVIMDGKRGLRQCWPMALVLGIAFGGGQFLASNFFAYELTDVVACLIALLAGIGFLQVWTPEVPDQVRTKIDASALKLSRTDGFLALFPYFLIVVVFGITKLWTWGIDIPAALNATTITFGWPGLHGRLVDAAGEPVASTLFTFNWLSSPGTILFFCGVVTLIVYVATSRPERSLKVGEGFAELFIGFNRMKLSYLTIASVMGLAYVMNFSGQTGAIGALLAGTGVIFPLLSPILGWLGTAVTGSATSSTALFAPMQASTAATIGVPEHLLVGANYAGAVTGKMISPQTVALAAATVKMQGEEGKIMGQAMRYSLGMLAVMCVLVFLQSTVVLGWMVP